MIHLTEAKIGEKKIEEYMKNKLYNVSKNRNFKLFSLDDKDLGIDAFDKLELIAYPENCII